MDFYLTNKIPFLDVYGDINLVGHVIKSHKAQKLHVEPYTYEQDVAKLYQ